MANSKGKFLLCYHDFSIDSAQIVFSNIQKIKSFTGKSFPVLVVPNTSNASSLKISEFSSMLKELENDNFELLLHGCTHHANLTQKRTLYGRFALSLTQNEAEFAGLSEKDSLESLNQAYQYWQNLDLKPPVGFVAPTWHANPFLKKQVLKKNIIFEERLKIISPTGKSIYSPVVSFAGIPSLTLPLAFAYGNLIMGSKIGVPRLALHPVDFPKLESKIFALIEKTIKLKKTVFYRDLF
ncbi:MAG: DUF2334 domain-containing protein [Fibrobacteraceae bacterium]|nr:DUF2334 domain-containing protein [Fibrobacteraceae bacterium]